MKHISRWIAAHRELAAAVAGFAILVLAFFALSDLLHELKGSDIRRSMSTIPLANWLLAGAFTCGSFLCLTFYDAFALKVIGAKMPYPVTARAGASSYAISNMLGLSLLTGGSVRLRIYGRAGLSGDDVARVVALAAATFWSGVFVLFAFAIVFSPGQIAVGHFVVPNAARWLLALAILGSVCGYLAWTAKRPRELRAGKVTLPLPGPTAALGQILVAAMDVSMSAGVLFVLLPEVSFALYPQFLAAYVVAVGVAVLTHSPGGLGVFEAMIVLLLPSIAKPELAAALIGYRVVYYVLPFAIAVVSLAIAEGGRLRRRARPLARAGQSVAVSLAPLAMAALVFGAGATLILTGALPATRGRIDTLLTILPPFLLDLSHAAASVLGTVLMFVAYGLQRRLDIAWLSAIIILVSGAIAALLRGMDIEEAALLLSIAALLGWTRPAFYRQSALMAERPDGRWLAAIVSVLAVSLFLGFFAYKNVEYRNALWLQFAPSGNAARFLRGSLVALLALCVIALNRATRPVREPTVTTLPQDVWDKALASCDRTEAHLARTGDKAFIISAAGDAFLMYRVRGHSFIVMGDPVGQEERWSELVWRLREAADRQGGRIAFYECGPRFLPYAVDLGLAIMKLGEEAFVALADFSLDGKARANLRHAVNRMEREHATFRLIEGRELEDKLPELRAISDQWLAEKGQREKQFSLGRFEPDYLRGGPIGIVEQEGRIVAFANLWTLPTRKELSFDLMRQRSDAPSGTMDFLFVSMILWGKAQGYERISLGVAPLSGIESRRLAPLWARIAGTVFQHGERLYGYRGLRQYKEKFRPEWRGSYFAAPRGLSMAAALIDVTLLVSAPSPSDGERRTSRVKDRTEEIPDGLPLPDAALPRS